MKIAILDDYQNVALQMADWSVVAERAEITVFTDHTDGIEALAEQLAPFDVICVMRERTPLPKALLERLPALRLIASTAGGNASIDTAAAAALGIAVVHTGYVPSPTVELTWGLILASARDLLDEASAVRNGGWQRSVGTGLRGKTLGILGLGNIGSQVAAIGEAFGMNVIAWSPNITAERGGDRNITILDRETFFATADIVSIHMVLTGSTRGLIDRETLALMKSTARLINTSRGPLVREEDLVEALREGVIAGAAVDVYDIEPLPADHPYRSLPNLLATPHIGYVSEEQYRIFYGDTVANITSWLDQNSDG